MASLLISTRHGSSQTIEAPNGVLHIGVSLEEAERILQGQGRLARDGSTVVETVVGGRSYRAYFSKPCHSLPFADAATGAAEVSMWEQATGIEPTEATYQALAAEYRSTSQGHNVRHFPLCQRWVIEGTTVTLGVICGKLAVRAHRMKGWETFGPGGGNPCTNACF